MGDTSLARLRRYAYWLDSASGCPGLAGASASIRFSGCCRASAIRPARCSVAGVRRGAPDGVPAPTLARMLLNLALDSSVGAVPVLGRPVRLRL